MDMLEKVLEKLGTTESTTLRLKYCPQGSIPRRMGLAGRGYDPTGRAMSSLMTGARCAATASMTDACCAAAHMTLTSRPSCVRWPSAVRRNVPLRRDPERFHVKRTCIANTAILGKFTLGVVHLGRFVFGEAAAQRQRAGEFRYWTLGEMAVVEKVLEKLGTTESTTIVPCRVKRTGKIRIASQLWETPKVILKGEMLEIRNVEGRLHIARKPRFHDEWDPKVEPSSRRLAPAGRLMGWAPPQPTK
jgi:hypothetical protein